MQASRAGVKRGSVGLSTGSGTGAVVCRKCAQRMRMVPGPARIIAFRTAEPRGVSCTCTLDVRKINDFALFLRALQ
jgi:hypothetical protein